MRLYRPVFRVSLRDGRDRLRDRRDGGGGNRLRLLRKTFPTRRSLRNYEPPVMTRVHAGDGSILAEYSHERRLFLPSAAIPPLVKQAFISAEDKNFYTHNGIDPEGIARAVLDPRAGRSKHVQGASTITQQVAKNFLVGNERSLRAQDPRGADLVPHRGGLFQGQDPRALSQRDLSRPRQLRRRRRGAELFQQIGARADGRGSRLSRGAAEGAEQLLIPSATATRAIERRNYVIDRMVDDGYVSQEDGEKAKTEPLGVNPRVALAQHLCRRLISPRKCAANCSSATAKRSSTKAACRCARRSTRRCRSVARKALVDGLVRFDEAHGFRGADAPYRHLASDWGVAARRHSGARRRAALAARRRARRQ